MDEERERRMDPEGGDASRRHVRAPFGETADPDAYVPRPALDALVSRLDRWLDKREGPALASLAAAPGMGRSTLLRLLESRFDARARTLYLPYASLSFEDLSAWVLGLLGLEKLEGRGDLDCALADPGASPLVLLIDDADGMPAETAEGLCEVLLRHGPRLRAVISIGDDARATRLLARFDPVRPLELTLREPMSREETARYITARLAWADAGLALRARFDDDAIGHIHGLSGGVPRRIHELATEHAEPLPEAVKDSRRRVDWLGQPLESADGGDDAEKAPDLLEPPSAAPPTVPPSRGRAVRRARRRRRGGA